MGRMSRTKGAAGERELRRLFEAELGTYIVRNLEQTYSGGQDLLGVDVWAVQVKRDRHTSHGRRAAWWGSPTSRRKGPGCDDYGKLARGADDPDDEWIF